MANIKIIVDGALMDGHKVSFKAPCNCVAVEKLKVCYVENGEQKTRLFTMRDSHNNDLTGLGNLFSEGAIVYAVLDTVKGYAYLQNAGTNGYLERKITPVDNLESDRADLPLSARQGKILNDSLVAEDNLKFRFSTDGEGNYGYLGADDSFIPFKNGTTGKLTVSAKATLLLRQQVDGVDYDYNHTTVNVSFEIDLENGVITLAKCSGGNVASGKTSTFRSVITAFKLDKYDLVES